MQAGVQLSVVNLIHVLDHEWHDAHLQCLSDTVFEFLDNWRREHPSQGRSLLIIDLIFRSRMHDSGSCV